MSHNKKEVGSGAIFFLIAVALYAGSYAIVVTTNDAMGPQSFPRTVTTYIGVLVVVQAVPSLEKERKEQGLGERSDFSIGAAATIGILFAYALLVQTVGLIAMTAVYLLTQIPPLLPEEHPRSGKSILVTTTVSAATPTLIYELSYRAFNILLSTGLLG